MPTSKDITLNIAHNKLLHVKALVAEILQTSVSTTHSRTNVNSNPLSRPQVVNCAPNSSNDQDHEHITFIVFGRLSYELVSQECNDGATHLVILLPRDRHARDLSVVISLIR